MVKVFVTKEQYDQVRAAEKASGTKVGKTEGWEFRVPDCIDGQHGVYKVKRCYRSGLKYIADMELIEATTSEEHSMLVMMALTQKSMAAGKFKLIVTD